MTNNRIVEKGGYNHMSFAEHLLSGDVKSATRQLQEQHTDIKIEILMTSVGMSERIRIAFSKSAAVILMHGDVLPSFVPIRLSEIMPLIVFWTKRVSVSGEIELDLSDGGALEALSFSQPSSLAPMMPDCGFVGNNAYEEARIKANNFLPWKERKPQAIWRGSTTGQRSGSSWQELPRIRLCQITRACSFPHLFDCAISQFVQLMSESEEAEMHKAGLTAPLMPFEEFGTFQYQIDIDGNTNSWPGLFTKLLTGSPVLKVLSPYGYRQWYYNRLEPWYNYVPILSDMSDLVEKLIWLIFRPDHAEAIGRAGRQLALAMTLEEESWRVLPVVDRLLGAEYISTKV